MTHNLDLLPWLRRMRRQMAAVLVIVLAALFVAESVYSGLSDVPMLSVPRAFIGGVMPWLELGCGIVALASWAALTSTWWARDWWAERWVRSHESFVG